MASSGVGFWAIRVRASRCTSMWSFGRETSTPCQWNKAPFNFALSAVRLGVDRMVWISATRGSAVDGRAAVSRKMR